MRRDLATVLWKEWRSVVSGRARRQLLLVGAMLGFQAVLFPMQSGTDWLRDPVPLAILGIITPLVIVGIVVPDAIAGERERHTLSTLLASPLADRAILYGKLGFAVAVGWTAGVGMLLLGLLIANAAAWAGTVELYDPVVLASVLVLGLLAALLTGGVGVFVSLRAGTAQEAQQLTVTGLLVPIMVLSAALMFVAGDPGLRRQLLDQLATVDGRAVTLAVMGGLAVIDAALLLAADRRFRRARLIAR